MNTASSSPRFNYGFPTPGPQAPTGEKVMEHCFFLDEAGWKQAREEQAFDYVVVGSGFCALGFIERTLKHDPHARILVLERGSFFLPEHFQNLALPYKQTLGGLSETFPWTLSPETHQAPHIKWQHGMVPFFGGRSIMWSAWCPRPTRAEMAGWPEPVIEAAHEYFAHAEALLNVVSADQIDRDGNVLPRKHRPIFGTLQDRLGKRLAEHLGEISSATRVMPAPLAVGARDLQVIDFDKFSTPGPLLELADRQAQLAKERKGAPLAIATRCTVERILQHEGKAVALETSRGVLNVADARVILAMGTLPPTTLLLNSFPKLKNAGNRFTAHFISSIIARVPRADYEFHAQIADLELGAIYLAGVDPETGGQYHVQLTVLSDQHPERNARAAQRFMPDVVATASMAQLASSKDHVVFVCAVLGELDHQNAANWLRRNDGADPTNNVTLQVLEGPKDGKVWDTMETGTFQMLERVLSPKGQAAVEYWHGDPDKGSWSARRPSSHEIRVPSLVHEGSTLWIGEDADAPVGLDYRPRGVENVYVTGASLWPRGGSWNPTMTMVALSQHLADHLAGKVTIVPRTRVTIR